MLALFGLPAAVVEPCQPETELHAETENGEVQELLVAEKRPGDALSVEKDGEMIIRVMEDGIVKEMDLSEI